jgi:hypothetical protein
MLLMQLPVFKIWTGIIEFLAPKCSFLIQEKGFAFERISITRSALEVCYTKDSMRMVLTYANESQTFYAVLQSTSDPRAPIAWKTNPPPRGQTISTMAELENNMVVWLDFLKKEV